MAKMSFTIILDRVKNIKWDKVDAKLKYLFFVSVLAGLVFIIANIAKYDFSWWTATLLVLWIIVINIFSKRIASGQVFGSNVLVIFAIAVALSFVFMAKTAGSGHLDTNADTATGDSQTTEGGITTSSNKEIEDCKFAASDSAVEPAGYEVRLFSSDNIDIGVGELRTATNTSTFKLSDFVLGGSAAPETVFFTVYGDTDRFIPGVSVTLQVCNSSTNKSASLTPLDSYNATPTSDNTSGVEIEMSPIDTPDKTGSYRIDGLMKIDGGDWELVARKNVQFK